LLVVVIVGLIALDRHYSHGVYTDRAQAMLGENPAFVQVVVSLGEAGGLGGEAHIPLPASPLDFGGTERASILSNSPGGTYVQFWT
jgi:hypothetical protein